MQLRQLHTIKEYAMNIDDIKAPLPGQDYSWYEKLCMWLAKNDWL